MVYIQRFNLLNYTRYVLMDTQPSTLSDFPESQDGRTFHEARPVIKGTKFAANSWIHMYDYEIPNLW